MKTHSFLTTSNDDIAPTPQVAASPEQVRPLKVNDHAAIANLRDIRGELIDIASLYASQPIILIFYRGGWCPYCSTQLMDLVHAEPKLVELGYQILAVSPDRPEAMKESVDKNGFSYQLLSDSDMALSQAFGLAYKVDEPTLVKLHSHNIDLEKASGKKHHLLPVPAVYIIDTKGIVRFAHWDADYTKRLPADKLLETAKSVAAM